MALFAKKDCWIRQNLGCTLQTIDRNLLEVSTSVSSNGGSELVCSYNWVDRKMPTIYVPGGAPGWQYHPLPVHILQDSGEHFIDQNSARCPRFPFEPTFKAMAIMNPHFRMDEIDVLVNRNSLRKLLRFCSGQKQDNFRLNVYLVRDTLIVERCEKLTVETGNTSDQRGYGHNFERRFTQHKPELEDSTGHHRVIRYDLGDLRVVVRAEVDACYLELNVNERTNQFEGQEEADETSKNLAQAFGSLKVSHGSDQTNATPNTYITALHKGSGSQQAQLAEIKTGKQASAMRKIMPQVWFGRTPFLIKGQHVAGTFDRVEVTKISDQFETWEAKAGNQEALRKLVHLLSSLRHITRDTEGKACIAICMRQDHGQLRLFLPSCVKRPLPDDTIARFWSRAR